MTLIKIYDVDGLLKEIEVKDITYIKVDGLLVWSSEGKKDGQGKGKKN